MKGKSQLMREYDEFDVGLHDSCGVLNLVESHDESCKGDDGRSDVARPLL
jgi:hypothetical protein